MAEEARTSPQTRELARAPSAPGRGGWWRLEHHWWILLILVPFGWLVWAAFGYLGIRLRKAAWVLSGAVYLVLTVTAWVIYSGAQHGWRIGAFTLISLFVWIGGFIHGLTIRREALERLSIVDDPSLRAARDASTARAAAGDLAAHAPEIALDAGVGQDADRFGGLIDLNHAPAHEIAQLPGFDLELAERVVKTREEINGFSSVLDFASVIDLPPSVVDRIRDRTVCIPR